MSNAERPNQHKRMRKIMLSHMLVPPRCVSISSSSAFVFTPSAFLPFSPLDHSHNKFMESAGACFCFRFLALFLFPLTKLILSPSWPMRFSSRSCGNLCLPHDPTVDNDFRESSAHSGCDENAETNTFSQLHRRLQSRTAETSHLNNCFCFCLAIFGVWFQVDLSFSSEFCFKQGLSENSLKPNRCCRCNPCENNSKPFFIFSDSRCTCLF